MTQWKATVAPRLGTTDGPGWCLRFAQSFFGAPAMYDSAWEAWEATQHRHGAEVPLPDVPVLLWFEHWGYYGPKGQERYGNWGDVRIHVPGDAIYGSPITGSSEGQSRVATIGEIERGIGATYVGWSEDINGLRVAEPGEEDDMFTDADRAMLAKTSQKANASYDALFKTGPTSLGTPAGVLRMTGAIYDSQFLETETSRGTPGGMLVNARTILANQAELLEQNALIMEALGIVAPGGEDGDSADQ